MLMNLFSSDERLRVIEFLLYNPGRELRVRAIARQCRVSPALVSGTLAMLKGEGIIESNKLDFLEPETKALKLLLNVGKIKSIRLIPKIKESFRDCRGIGLYGSWANGTNYKDSDIDIWIKASEENDQKISRISRIIKQKLAVEASVLVLTEKRLKEMKAKDFVFYCMFHNSFLLWGEGI